MSFSEAGATTTAACSAVLRGSPATNVSAQAIIKAATVPSAPPHTVASMPCGGIICARVKILPKPKE